MTRNEPARPRRLLLLLCLGLTSLAGLAASGLHAQPAEPPLTVTGTLVDERGVPAAGVEVILRPYPSTYELDLDLLGYDALPAAVDRTQSGPDGSFLLKAPVPGPYRFEIRTAAPAESPDAVVPLVYGNLAPLEASRALQANELPDRHLVATRILDADHRPIEGALVIASPTRTRSPRYERRNSDHRQPERLYPRFQPAAARTDERGNARFLMPTANANITVSASGFSVETGTTKGGRAAFVLARDPGIRFRVRGPDGAPAHGVVLRTGDKTKTPIAITDEQGDVIAGNVAGAEASYELERWDNAFARVPQPNAAPADAAAGARIVDLRLEAPLRIPGRIVDRVSGDPVANAAIWIVGSPGENAQSGPTGEFLLNAGPREESARLWVQAGGYVSTGVSTVIPEYGVADETAVTLRPAAPLYGFVTDSTDQPVAGADISAQPRATESIASMIAIRPQRATSAGDGSFRMAGIVYDNPYRLTIRAEGFASSAIDLPSYERSATAGPVRIRLTKGRRAWGRVVDTEGSPVAGAEVKLRWPEQKQPRFPSRRDTDATEPVTTDDQGAFRIAAVKTGEYDVRVSHAEYVSPGDLPIEVPEGRGEVDLGEFKLVPGAEILGVVVDPDEEPVEGALVKYRSYGLDRDQERTAQTDADGGFRLTGLPHEQVDLTVEAEGYPQFYFQGARPATGEPIRIQLLGGASLSGRVLTAAGTAADGARVRLEPDMRTRMQSRIFSSRDTTRRTDGDGRFRFDSVFPGTWSVEASAGTEAARTDPLELISGSERAIELHLHAQDQLTVIVTTFSGQPVTEARVRLEPKDAAQSRESGFTDGSGRAQLEVAAGPATLTVVHAEHLDETREIVVGPGSTELAVQLQAGGEISGFVRSASGAPVSATVEAHPRGIRGNGRQPTQIHESANHDGRRRQWLLSRHRSGDRPLLPRRSRSRLPGKWSRRTDRCRWPRRSRRGDRARIRRLAQGRRNRPAASRSGAGDDHRDTAGAVANRHTGHGRQLHDRPPGSWHLAGRRSARRFLHRPFGRTLRDDRRGRRGRVRRASVRTRTSPDRTGAGRRLATGRRVPARRTPGARGLAARGGRSAWLFRAERAGSRLLPPAGHHDLRRRGVPVG